MLFYVVFMDEVHDAFSPATQYTASTQLPLTLSSTTMWLIAVTDVNGQPHGGEKTLNFTCWQREGSEQRHIVCHRPLPQRQDATALPPVVDVPHLRQNHVLPLFLSRLLTHVQQLTGTAEVCRRWRYYLFEMPIHLVKSNTSQRIARFASAELLACSLVFSIAVTTISFSSPYMPSSLKLLPSLPKLNGSVKKKKTSRHFAFSNPCSNCETTLFLCQTSSCWQPLKLRNGEKGFSPCAWCSSHDTR